jgi:hypothetical protein
MGGLGSGRRPTQTSVDDCRVLEIGELCDAGRVASQPRGEISWVAKRSGITRAQLSYTIAAEDWPGGPPLLMLALRYRKTLSSPESCDYIVLSDGGARRWVARCPTCRRPVRRLYAPPDHDSFLCRDCQGLVYRRRPQQTAALTQVQATMGSLLGSLTQVQTAVASAGPAAARRGAPEALLRALADDLPLGPQELRLYCLRLSKAGLSLRQIAALVDTSKSSVARYLAAGLDGVDIEALVSEWLERFAAFPAAAAGDGPKALRAQLKMIRRHARLSGLYRAPASEPEERVLVAGRADEGAGTASEGPI